MAKTSSKKLPGFKFSHTLIIGVLSFVAGIGGYGEYSVYQQQGAFGAGFEDKLHTVERIIDGDTIVLEDKTTVRLLLIDAPELDQCFGSDAKKGLEKLVLGQKVRLQKDFTASDFKNRLLRYVFIVPSHPKDNSIFVNEELLKAGFARFQGEARDKLFQEVLSHTATVAKNDLKGLYGK
jgi:endonuclease YncB( thermonuclease family)